VSVVSQVHLPSNSASAMLIFQYICYPIQYFSKAIVHASTYLHSQGVYPLHLKKESAHLSIRYCVIFWYTQKIPTHKSAKARLAKQKLVIERILQWRVTTRITSKFPGKTIYKKLIIIIHKCLLVGKKKIYHVKNVTSNELIEKVYSPLKFN